MQFAIAISSIGRYSNAVPRATSIATKQHRRHVVIPGILMPTLKLRWEEFAYPAFAPYALELICFDLRKRGEHIVTLSFARDTTDVQDAINRLLICQYEPGPDIRGPLIQAIFGESSEPRRAIPRGQFAAYRDYVRFSERLRPCIEERWREAGYESFSAYLTGLIRYDLLLLGPHKYYNGFDTDPVLLEAMDRGTEREFRENKPQPFYIHRLIDEVVGRKLTDEERTAVMRKLADYLREWALRERGGKRVDG